MLVIIYFTVYIDATSATGSVWAWDSPAFYVRNLAILFQIYFGVYEVYQLLSNRLAYFTDIFNIFDITSVTLNTFIFLSYGYGFNWASVSYIRSIASIAVILMYFKLFYWMRLFKPFSAFIRMITEIIKDIQVFMVMLIIALMSFANVIFILNLNREE